MSSCTGFGKTNMHCPFHFFLRGLVNGGKYLMNGSVGDVSYEL